MSKNIQFNLRIPEVLKTRISEAATNSGRSVNSEAQYRLESSFENQRGEYRETINELKQFFDAHLYNRRLIEVSQKLNYLLEEAKLVRDLSVPSVSRIAEHLGLDTVSSVQDWFDGKEEPSFNQLDILAQYFNCEPNWLKHNEGVPFKKSMFRFTEDIESNAKQLLNRDTESDEYVKKVWFARNNSQAGELIIVKHFDSWRGEILKTNVHVSDIVGSSGMRDRALMSLTLKYLCKHHIIKVHGAIISEEQYSQLLWAKENPLKILEKFRNNTWVEDIWDEQMYLEQGDTYWQGWQQLCVDNANYIHNHDRLSKILL